MKDCLYSLSVSSTAKRSWLSLLALVVIAAALLQGAGAALAQQRGEEVEIDRAWKEAIIDSLCYQLNKTYVFPDIADKLEKQLRKNLKKKKYDSITALGDFARQLSEDMREIAHDGHLWIRPASEEEIRRSQVEEPTDEDRERYVLELAWANFGFERVERLDANIGYLKFNQFADATYAGATAVAALNFLSNCDAMIIDLRDNGGGYPNLIQLMSSYFFEESTHLNTFYIRESDEYHQFWTQSHVQGRRMTDIPLFVLTSSNTFSGAEEFTYNMKNLERATIIGETTGGGAHPTHRHIFAEQKVMASVPFGRAINPITNTNWEGAGIEPHIKVPRDQALEVAKLEAMKAVRGKYGDERHDALVDFAIKRLDAMIDPVTVHAEVLSKWVGDYGPRHIMLEDGALWYERDERPKYKMIPISETLFCFDEVEFFMLEIETDDSGNPVALIGIYNNGNTDRSPRGEN
jgi:hypothetical protein